MEIELKHIGGSRYTPSRIIELTVKCDNGTITEDITDRNSFVSGNFINSLREIADELEEHNTEVTNTKNK